MSSAADQHYAERRELIRNTYLKFAKDTNLEFKFVISSRVSPENLQAVQVESLQNNQDIILLDTVDSGIKAQKTLDFFHWVAVNRPNVTYIMKADDDAWLHPYHIQRLLVTLPREKAYWGHMLPSPVPGVTYFAGMGYVLSQDLVQWVLKNNDTIHNNKTLNDLDGQYEDIVMGYWMNAAGITTEMNSVAEATNCEVYDWGPMAPVAHKNLEAESGLPPAETILIHKLKERQWFIRMHEYFIGSLRRWSACVELQWRQPQCKAALNFGLWFTR